MDNKKKNILEIINMQEYNVLAYMEDSPVRLKAQNKNWTIIIYKNYVTEEIEIHFSNDIKEINGNIGFSFDELPFEKLNILDPKEEFINDLLEDSTNKDIVSALNATFEDFPPIKECVNKDVIHLCLHCNQCNRFEEKIELSKNILECLTIEKAMQNRGRRVVYDDGHLVTTQSGIITNANNSFVFVLYDGDKNTKSILPRHLFFEDEYKQAANENIRFMGKSLQEDKERNGYK